MKITISIDAELVKQARKIASERDATLTRLVRTHLEALVAAHARSGRRRQEPDALERSFEQLQVRVGKINWKREDLHDRP